MDAFIGLATAYTKEALPLMSGDQEQSPVAAPRKMPSRSESHERPPSAKSRPNTAESDDAAAGLELGRLGFKKLILDGKLLGLPKGTADASYESVDSDASGCVSFSEVWIWFLYQARQKNQRSPGSVNIQLETILSPKERAITALMKRFVK
jgi:hypothetical protein